MAIMIPEKPRSFKKESKEDEIFKALEKLPEEYYVVHSFGTVQVNNNTLYEGETDFVIFSPKRGLLAIEAKAGQVQYKNGVWRYANGDEMSHDGPYDQASKNKYKIRKLIENSNLAGMENRLKMLHAVWFPSLKSADFAKIKMPSEADRYITLTMEDLIDPTERIEKIFELQDQRGVKQDLSTFDTTRFITDILCPEFNVFPSVSYVDDMKKIAFHRLLDEQSAILDFLVKQRTAVINGAAGTGKTMIAVRKASKLASSGEKVLFLCYNTMLKEYLEKEYAKENVDYYTVAGLACKFCNTAKADFKKLKSCLDDMYFAGSFPYDHVVIDEGQDFGAIEENKTEETGNDEIEILETIKAIVTDNKKGTFYVFYDELQTVHSKTIPNYIKNADCKVTLYKNCRNTKNIANTSLKPVSERAPELMEGSVAGTPARIHYCKDNDSAINELNTLIKELRESGNKDSIAILTCKTEATGLLAGKVKDGKYMGNCTYTTCRKFKGLERDTIILVDVDETTFCDNSVSSGNLVFYVGASRARLYLHVITCISEDGCKKVLKNTFKKTDEELNKLKNVKKEFASALNATGKMVI